MNDWWSGMTGNLVADFITVLIIYLIGQRFLDRRVADHISIEIIDAPPIPSELVPRRFAGQIVNNSGETIYNVGSVTGVMQSDGAMGIDRVSFVLNGRLVRVISALRPGEEAVTVSIPLVPEHGDALRVVFFTVRRRCYGRWLMGPNQRLVRRIFQSDPLVNLTRKATKRAARVIPWEEET